MAEHDELPVWSSAGDDRSRFIEELGPPLVRALLARTGDRLLAEDLAQEALAKALVNWETVRLMEYPNAWVYRVAFNACSSHWRRRLATRRAERRAASTDRVELNTAEVLAVRSALAGLTRRQAEAVILRHLVGLSVRATAEAMGVGEGTVKTLTHRGLLAMRGVLGDD